MSKLFVSNLPAVLVALETTNRKALRAAADIGRNQVVTNISGSRSGIRYRVPGTQTDYTASAPGEYPAVRLGGLKGSVRVLPKGDDLLIGTDLDYGLYLEKKPPDKGGREWLRPSLEQAKPRMLAELAKRRF